MSGVRLYIDEDAGETAVVRGLRARGLDVLTTIEAQRCGATDRDQLAFAVQQGRSIYTFNVGDFARLHREYLLRGIDHSDQNQATDDSHKGGQQHVAEVSDCATPSRMAMLGTTTMNLLQP